MHNGLGMDSDVDALWGDVEKQRRLNELEPLVDQRGRVQRFI